MARLGKTDILKARPLRTRKVEVPEWGEEGDYVLVREMTGAERDQYEDSRLVRRGDRFEITNANVRAKLCSLTICDEDGQRIFTDAEAAQLGKQSAAALDRCFAAALELSGLTKADQEELEKNSEGTTGDG